MTDRTTLENIEDGDFLGEGYFNVIPGMLIPPQTYTGTDFDSVATSSTTDTNNHTLTILSTGLLWSSKIRISITYKAASQAVALSTNYSSSASLHIEHSVKDAGSWGDVLANTNVSASSARGDSDGRDSSNDKILTTLDLWYEPTAPEIAGGLDLKFTSTSTDQNSGSASFTLVAVNLFHA